MPLTFMEVVQQGVMQAFAMAPRHKRGRITTPERAKRLLEYKGQRIERSLFNYYGTVQVIFD